MSKQALVAFGDRVMEDKALHNRVRTLKPNDAEGLIAIAEDAGFSFTADELMEVVNDVKKQMESGELTENELETVAGGAQVDYFTKPMTFLASYFVMTPPSYKL
jgi:predicted ribosomally synthesized peptide with nif11-like leader